MLSLAVEFCHRERTIILCIRSGSETRCSAVAEKASCIRVGVLVRIRDGSQSMSGSQLDSDPDSDPELDTKWDPNSDHDPAPYSDLNLDSDLDLDLDPDPESRPPRKAIRLAHG